MFRQLTAGGDLPVPGGQARSRRTQLSREDGQGVQAFRYELRRQGSGERQGHQTCHRMGLNEGQQEENDSLVVCLYQNELKCCTKRSAKIKVSKFDAIFDGRHSAGLQHGFWALTL